MTWEQQLCALQALGEEVTLHMRAPRDWLVRLHRVEVGDSGLLESCSGNGCSPEDAVRALWMAVTELLPPRYLVIRAMTPERRAVRWNGFMWATVQENTMRQA